MNNTIEQEPSCITEVQNIVNELFRSFDAKEWDQCRSLLMDVVEVNISTPTVSKLAKYSADDLINKWNAVLHKNKKSYRHFGKKTVEINDGMASVSSKSYIFHRLEDCDKQEFWELWGDYTHFLIETENGWKCSGFTLSIPAQSANYDILKFLPENEIKN
jgi:hypothetical protein